MKTLKLIFILFLIPIFAFGIDPSYYEDQKFDITNYSAIIDLSDENQLFIKGECNINFNLDADFQDPFVIFHLTELNVDSVVANNNLLEFQEVGTIEDADYHFKVFLDDINSTEITVYYSGEMTSEYPSRFWGGVHDSLDVVYALGVGFYNNYVSATRHWLPCYDLPSDKATYDLTFITEAENQIYSIGTSYNSSLEIEGKNISSWKTDIPTSSYLVTFAESNFTRTNVDTDIETFIVHQENQKEQVEYAFQNMAEITKIFEDQFGAYPFEKIGYVLTDKGAMEHQTMINIANSTIREYERSKNPYGSVIIHELAHQWFGNLVTPYDFRDAWLNESFATWCEAYFKEAKFGKLEYWSELRKFGEDVFTTTGTSIRLPIYDYDKSVSSNYPYHVIYLKGAIVVSAIRDKLGDKIFDNAIKKHLDQYKYSNANIDDIKSSFEEESGVDLSVIFNEWIRKPGWPVVRYYIEQLDGEHYVVMNQFQTDIEELEEFSETKFFVEFTDNMGNEVAKSFILTTGENRFLLENYDGNSEIKVNEYENHYALIRLIDVTGVKKDFDDNYSINQNASIIRINVETNPPFQVSLFDMLGNSVFESKLESKEMSIKIDSIPSGPYMLIIQDKDNHYLKKIIK